MQPSSLPKYILLIEENFNHISQLLKQSEKPLALENIIKLLNKSFEYLHFSVISGEYYDLLNNNTFLDTENIRKDIEQINDKIIIDRNIKTKNVQDEYRKKIELIKRENPKTEEPTTKKNDILRQIENLKQQIDNSKQLLDLEKEKNEKEKLAEKDYLIIYQPLKKIEEILNSLSINIEQYKKFISVLTDSLQNHDTNYIYSDLNSSNLDEENKDFKGIYEKSLSIEGNTVYKIKQEKNLKHENYIYRLSLSLSYFDEGYICDFETLRKLIQIHLKLKIIKIENSIYLNILTEKVVWLIYKLLYRLKKTVDIDIHKIYDELIEDYEPYGLNVLNIENNSFYKKFHKSLSRCYPLQDTTHSKKYYNKIRSALLSERCDSIEEIHFICKVIKNDSDFLKNINLNLRQAEQLFTKKIKLFEKNANTTLTTFDQYASYSAKKILENSLVKLKLNNFNSLIKDSTSPKRIIEYIEQFVNLISIKITDTKDKDARRINPSFQLFRICTTESLVLFSNLNDKIDSISFNDDNKYELINLISSVRKLTELLNKYSIHYNSYFEIVKISRWMPVFQFNEGAYLKASEFGSYNEANSISIDDCPERIILDSSYVLPSNYLILEQKMVNDVKLITTEDFLLRGAISIKILETYDSRLDDKVKESQTNAIQIIALYASIITFVLGSISVVPKFDYSYVNILLFMVLFASCLCLFVFLLKFMFSKKEKSILITGREFIVFVFFGIIAMASALCIREYRKEEHEYFNTTTTKTYTVDTINKLKSDTIINIIGIKSNYMPKSEDEKKK